MPSHIIWYLVSGNPEDYMTLPRESLECIPMADIRTIDQQLDSEPLRKIQKFWIYYVNLDTVLSDIPQFLYLPGELSQAQS